MKLWSGRGGKGFISYRSAARRKIDIRTRHVHAWICGHAFEGLAFRMEGPVPLLYSFLSTAESRVSREYSGCWAHWREFSCETRAIRGKCLSPRKRGRWGWRWYVCSISRKIYRTARINFTLMQSRAGFRVSLLRMHLILRPIVSPIL